MQKSDFRLLVLVLIFLSIVLLANQIGTFYVMGILFGRLNLAAVTDTTPPTTAVASPLAGTSITMPTMTVTASASDNVGVIRVELWKNGTLASTSTTWPYVFNIPTQYNFDLNADGSVDAMDKLIMAQCQAHILTNSRCDINLNGTTDATDELLMANAQAHIVNNTVNLQTKAYDTAGNVGVSPIVSVTATPITAANVLVVYNTNSSDSVALKNYYLAHRPGFSGVNTLGISTSDVEIMSLALYQSDIRQPVVNWLQANPSKQIYYVVLLRGIPDRTSSGYAYSVDFQLSLALAELRIRGGVVYSQNQYCVYNSAPAPNYCKGGNTGLPYIPVNYLGTTALVTHLNMGSLAATEAYIDKLNAMYQAMPVPNVIISATRAGKGGTNYYIDETQGYAAYPTWLQADKTALTTAGASISRITYYPQTSTTHISQGADVLGYETWGANGSFGGDYAINGSIKFAGNSNWYLIKTVESFNGQWSAGQGNFVKWFSANAFGGTNYSNTPVGAVTHVEEPGLDGIEGSSFLADWEKGMLFAEAAWDSRQTTFFMAVGDPLVTK